MTGSFRAKFKLVPQFFLEYFVISENNQHLEDDLKGEAGSRCFRVNG